MWQRHFEVPKRHMIIHLAKHEVLSPLRQHSSMNMTSDVPPAWRGSRVVRHYLISSSLTDGSVVVVRCLATGPVPNWLPSVGLHESYDVCTQGPHNRRINLANSQSCKMLEQRFRGHAGQNTHPNRWGPLWTTSVRRALRNCTCAFNSAPQ